MKKNGFIFIAIFFVLLLGRLFYVRNQSSSQKQSELVRKNLQRDSFQLLKHTQTIRQLDSITNDLNSSMIAADSAIMAIDSIIYIGNNEPSEFNEEFFKLLISKRLYGGTYDDYVRIIKDDRMRYGLWCSLKVADPTIPNFNTFSKKLIKNYNEAEHQTISNLKRKP